MTADPLAAACTLEPTLLELRERTEAERRLPPPIVEELVDSGLSLLAVPTSLGGLEIEPPQVLPVLEELAAAEASAAWIVWNCILPALLGRSLESATRREIFSEPAIFASSTRPSGRLTAEDGGYRLTGRWSLVSGCELAAWIPVMCVLAEKGNEKTPGSGEPELRLAWLPRDAFRIVDTWHVGGLRGTGSHDIEVEDLELEPVRVSSPMQAASRESELDALPIACFMGAGCAAISLGIARSAIDCLVDLAGSSTTHDPGPGMGDRPAVQSAVARQSVAVDAARMRLRSATEELWEETRGRAAEGSEARPAETIAATWAAAVHAGQVAEEAVDAMYAVGGTSSLYEACRLERAHRDIHAVLRHVAVQPFWLEEVGKVRLGMEPTHPLFLW